MKSLFFLVSVLAVVANRPAMADNWTVNYWNPPFDYGVAPESVTYQPLEKVTRKWRFCISYPHLKDPYWLSVNFGMTEEARRLGVAFRLVEAGGYPHLQRQILQIEDCLSKGADALIVGTVSYQGLTELLTRLGPNLPVIAAVNDIDSRGVAAKIGVSWTEMGSKAGAFLAARHPSGSPTVKIALFPGPLGAEWVDFVLNGFHRAIAGSAIEIVTEKRGDTGKEIQRNLVEEVLEENPDIDYIIGTAPTAEAAVSLLRNKGLGQRIKIVSFYLTHGVSRGIKRGRILAAPTDRPSLQGKMSIEQAVRVLEGIVQHLHMGPEILLVDQESIGAIDPLLSLAPASFIPVYKFP